MPSLLSPQLKGSGSWESCGALCFIGFPAVSMRMWARPDLARLGLEMFGVGYCGIRDLVCFIKK